MSALHLTMHSSSRRNKEEEALETVQTLLGHCAQAAAANHQGETRLHLALAKERLKFSKLLLDAGADINARDNKDWYKTVNFLLLQHRPDVSVVDLEVGPVNNIALGKPRIVEQ
ncbi:TPA: hypothetical protein ACH3X1_003939 [Trebouxia sp. C0004]